ncbi:protein kinase domain-containing protein [Anaerobutyricum hallii]|uniref:protein kinase domain-containing protein n=1 Tax=Anaerobutyricum hallii TaxID=39488 RepID=UPI0039924EA3
MEENLHCLRKGTRLIGRYTIEGVLGQGGFGITYLGIDELHEKKVAIKEFFPQGIVTRNIEYQDTVTVTFVGEKDNYEKGKERFLKEARTMAKFSKDEGIVKALDFFEINNTAYIVMEYLEGITLKQYLRENQRIAPEDLIELLVPLIESLDEIHSQGMIHRDISPDNIMVLPDGRIKLMDFGAARDYTEFGEKSLSIVLKPGYAPPEQYQTHGVQGPWTDIYALCATMYKCITGENPPDAIERVMDDSLKKISEFGITIPPQEEAAIIKGMSVSAKDRYQDIKDFCEDLYGAYEETPASENKESEVKPDLIKENVEDKVDTSAEETPESGSLASEEDVESEKESAKENREAVSQKKVDRKSLKQYENKEETSVQNVKSEPDNKKQSQPKKFSGKAVLAVILCILLVGGGVKLYSDKKEQQYTLHNPKIEDDSSAKSGKKVSWDCLWFGSYPQSKITEKDGDIYTTLKNTDNWDKNGDATINNIKYHTTEAGYFKYEPIKWRVLQSENGEAFLLSDVILDNQNYNEDYSTWEESSLRSWLNGEFMNRAFSDEKKEKINITEIVNQDNSDYGTEGGNNISDKISLLSSAEADENRDGKKYGFLNDETRKCKTNSFSEMEVALWWLSTGDVSNSTALVYEGIIIGEVYSIDYDNYGVRPALHLNLSSSNLFSYAGTVSSDGNENEVPYNTKTKLVQK